MLQVTSKRNTTQAKYEFIALNWGVVPVEQIAKYVKLDIPYIHIVVLRMRKEGVPIPSLSRKPRRPGNRGQSVDYQAITSLLKLAKQSIQ